MKKSDKELVNHKNWLKQHEGSGRDYLIAVPITGSAGTRNPHHKYASFLGLCNTRDDKEIILLRKKDAESTLKVRKKENRELYKYAFVSKK